MDQTNEICVRRIEVKDFNFIRDIASRQHTFTIPPTYVLWLLLKIKGDICLIAEDRDRKSLGYVLAVPISDPANSIYVWQLALADDSRDSEAALPLLNKLHEFARMQGVRAILFSALPGSGVLRRVKQYAKRFSVEIFEHATSIPEAIAPGEVEYKVELR